AVFLPANLAGILALDFEIDRQGWIGGIGPYLLALLFASLAELCHERQRRGEDGSECEAESGQAHSNLLESCGASRDRLALACRGSAVKGRRAHFSSHCTGCGWISSAGRLPASGRPLPANRLMARTAMSWSHTIWQLRRTPVNPRAARTSRSATVIFSGSPAT